MEIEMLGAPRGLKDETARLLLLSSLLCCLAFAACARSEPPPQPTPEPTSTPIPAPTATPTPTSVATPEARDTVSKEQIEEWTTIPAGTDAAPPDETPQDPGGSIGFSRYVFERVGDGVLTTLVEGPRDGQVRAPVSYEQLKKLRDEGAPPADLRMSLRRAREPGRPARHGTGRDGEVR